MDTVQLIFLNIFNSLSQFDRELFIFIHAKASSEKIDWLFKTLRASLTWVPLYAFLLYWLLRYHRKQAWQFILLTLVVFGITDHVSAAIMKPFFGRLRPCFEPSLEPYIRGVISCGGKFGMPSTHASNHFSTASFWFFSISWMSNKKWHWLWLWAFLVCYAQVYVGKHYPGDVLVGAIFGTLVGFVVALVFKRWQLKKEEVIRYPQ